MEVLLDEFYRQDLHTGHFVERKIQLDKGSYQITNISQIGNHTILRMTEHPATKRGEHPATWKEIFSVNRF